MKIYNFNIRSFTDEQYNKYYALMDAEKRARTDNFRNTADKYRTVAGEMLARRGIAQALAVAESDIIFACDCYGKPYAVGLDIQFNISHSGDYAVCAVSDKPVGIDIQFMSDIDMRIKERVCNAAEKEYIGDSITRFFEVWCAKEAYAKYRGIGLCDLKADISDGSFEKINIADGYICIVCK